MQEVLNETCDTPRPERPLLSIIKQKEEERAGQLGGNGGLFLFLPVRPVAKS